MGTVLLKYNGVVVIQSLPDNEPQTGRDLFDSIISRRCSLTGKGSYFYNSSTRQEFFNALDEVCANVVHDELFPIIHFEMHGNPMGLVMKNGEKITWKNFQDHCRMINVQMHNQLMISLAACCGCNIWEMIDIKRPAPYWGYIGPREEILVSTLIEDFTDFYDLLLSTENMDQAMSQLTVNGTRNQYFFLSCKAIFERFIEQHFENKPIDKKATFHRLKNETKQNLPWLNRSQRRKQLKTSISNLNRAAFIAQLKRTFLMLTDQ
ncbi:hypothetical protein [Mucilaginibacter polytrichastri]|uniref:Uncharacterized protein n=1 Tax=Mucilaginibacter polytrichastri TaxID=1302689 RepID=A0A1Q6A3X8_9SPHI|nr:hypothetical protein [Mucilaginibacter polytrichastri]OKS88708.1 hypothetical protein RG47T_4186 [Mucilaginibacter polytrichastri]SFT04690.1 hypothetical protein SAMN04487890_10940 [Mucilaginibacter polytrichastri]